MTELGVDVTTALLMGRIALLEELVRWLSIPYGDNEPVFAGADGMGTMSTDGNGHLVLGEVQGQARAMHTLWHQVTGREHTEPVVDRVMVQCEHCGAWHGEIRDGQ